MKGSGITSYVFVSILSLLCNYSAKASMTDTLYGSFLGMYHNDTLIVKTNTRIIDTFYLSSTSLSTEAAGRRFIVFLRKDEGIISCGLNGKWINSYVKPGMPFLTILKTEYGRLLIEFSKERRLPE